MCVFFCKKKSFPLIGWTAGLTPPTHNFILMKNLTAAILVLTALWSQRRLGAVLFPITMHSLYTYFLHFESTKSTVKIILGGRCHGPCEDRPQRSRRRSINLYTTQIARWHSLKHRWNPCCWKFARGHYLRFLDFQLKILEAPAPYGSRQGGCVIIFMPILLQGIPGSHTQKMVAIGSAVFAVPGNRQTDGRWIIVRLEAPAPYGSRQGGRVIIFMPILLQGVPGLHTQKMIAIGSAVFAVPGNRQTDGRWIIVRRWSVCDT